MTVSTTIAKSGPYAGAGTVGPFTVGFRFLQNSHLRVVRTNPDGVDTVLNITTDYSVSGAGNQTGSVTLTTALPVGWKLTILRAVPATQETDYVQNDAFPAESHERALDKLTMIVQQQGETLSRALTAPESDVSVSMVLPAASIRADKFLSFDEQGSPVSTAFSIDAINEASQAAIAAASAAAISEANAAESADDAQESAEHAEEISQLVSQQVAAVTPTVARYSGDDFETSFTLPSIPGSENNTQVYISGVYQSKDTYSIVGNILTFNEEPPTGTDNIEVVIAPAVQIMVGAAANISYEEETVKTRLDKSLYINNFSALAVGGDWALAITAALTQAQGRPVYLESGQTYEIATPIVYEGDVDLRVNGSTPATIFYNGQSFTPLTITGSTTGIIANLTADMQINNTGWNVDSAAGVMPGMLAAVKSSKSWYHDPRPDSSDARKSEFHKVARVIGTTIYMEDVANDGYDLDDETVTIEFFNPVRVSLKNIRVECVHAPVGPSAAWTNGIMIQYGIDSHLQDCEVKDAAGRGLYIASCYRTKIHGGTISGANNQGLGYAIQTSGSSCTDIIGVKFYANRKCIDLSGANIISRYSLVERCIAFGGGWNSEGNPYNWADNGIQGIVQVGFGGHGCADHCTYRGNFLINIRYGINSLSRNVVFDGNYFVGRITYGVYINDGENVWVRNNIAYDGWSNVKDGEIHTGFADINYHRMNTLVRIGNSWMGGKLDIRNNDVQVSTALVSFQNGTKDCDLTCKGNNIQFAVPVDSTQTYVIDSNVGSETVLGWDVSDNNYILKGTNAPQPQLFRGITMSRRSKLVDGNLHSGRYTATVSSMSNMSSFTNSAQQYMYTRIGDLVQVTGGFTFTPTNPGSTSTILISLPVDPNTFAVGDHAFGVVSSNSAGYGYCNAAPPNLVRIAFTATTSGSKIVKFNFTYRL